MRKSNVLEIIELAMDNDAGDYYVCLLLQISQEQRFRVTRKFQVKELFIKYFHPQPGDTFQTHYGNYICIGDHKDYRSWEDRAWFGPPEYPDNQNIRLMALAMFHGAVAAGIIPTLENELGN